MYVVDVEVVVVFVVCYVVVVVGVVSYIGVEVVQLYGVVYCFVVMVYIEVVYCVLGVFYYVVVEYCFYCVVVVLVGRFGQVIQVVGLVDCVVGEVVCIEMMICIGYLVVEVYVYIVVVGV